VLGDAGDENTIRIGNADMAATFIAGIVGATSAGGIPVYIDSAGKLGTITSSARFKRDIRSMEKASEPVLGLRPVTFHYKEGLDPNAVPQYGLLAEEVEKVDSDLVVRDQEGKPYTVRYEAVNAMLLNEFLKEHRKVQELEKRMGAVTAQLKEQGAQIQKVCAQIQTTKPTRKVVLRNQ